ncbi:MAG: hypothetical protein WD992_00880 [Candidatus Levyibacteriota bacterium]
METLQQLTITEDKFIPPLVEVLNESTHPQSEEISTTLKSSLDNLFPEQDYEEKELQKAKEILGPIVNELTPQELKDLITEIKFLIGSWLDDFEREIFGGMTLSEMLHEKGGL